jgi:hypothetical protein
MSDYPKWHNVADTTPLALVHNEIDAIRARLDAAGIPQVTINNPADQTEVARECVSVYTEGWDKGFAGEGDPYGISEYTGQSANPDAHVEPVHENQNQEG